VDFLTDFGFPSGLTPRATRDFIGLFTNHETTVTKPNPNSVTYRRIDTIFLFDEFLRKNRHFTQCLQAF
jgi:hypothetical protein